MLMAQTSIMWVQKNVHDRCVGGAINKTWRLFTYESWRSRNLRWLEVFWFRQLKEVCKLSFTETINKRTSRSDKKASLWTWSGRISRYRCSTAGRYISLEFKREVLERDRFGTCYHIGGSRILTLSEDSSRNRKWEQNRPRIIYTGDSDI